MIFDGNFHVFYFCDFATQNRAPESPPWIPGLAAAPNKSCFGAAIVPRMFFHRFGTLVSSIRRRCWINLAMISKDSPQHVRWYFTIWLKISIIARWRNRRVRVLPHFSYLISHIHILTISYSHILYWGDFYPHHQSWLNPALSSFCHTYFTYYTYLLTYLLYLLTSTLLTYGTYIICSFAHSNAYLVLSGAIWS